MSLDTSKSRLAEVRQRLKEKRKKELSCRGLVQDPDEEPVKNNTPFFDFSPPTSPVKPPIFPKPAVFLRTESSPTLSPTGSSKKTEDTQNSIESPKCLPIKQPVANVETECVSSSPVRQRAKIPTDKPPVVTQVPPPPNYQPKGNRIPPPPENPPSKRKLLSFL